MTSSDWKAVGGGQELSFVVLVQSLDLVIFDQESAVRLQLVKIK